MRTGIPAEVEVLENAGSPRDGRSRCHWDGAIRVRPSERPSVNAVMKGRSGNSTGRIFFRGETAGVGGFRDVRISIVLDFQIPPS
jgi:hypothetical protein